MDFPLLARTRRNLPTPSVSSRMKDNIRVSATHVGSAVIEIVS